MKIALLVPSIAFDGAIETPAVRVIAEQLASAVELHVFPIFLPTGSTPVRIAGLNLHPAGSGQKRFAHRLIHAISSIRREHIHSPFDLLHALWLHEPGTIAIAAGALFGLPVVASVGGAEIVALPDIEYGALRNSRGRLMTARVLQQATFVTGGSDYAVRRARSVIPHRDPGRFHCVPLPVSARAYQQRRERLHDATALRLLHVGSLIPVKDQPLLLRAFRRVVDVDPRATLTIVGDDPFNVRTDLDRLATDLRLTEAVTFAGAVSHAEMASFYRDADLLVSSSRHESQGLAVLEAAAAGVPTVGTAVGVVPDLAPEAAIAVRPGDPVALGDAIIGLLFDPVRLHRMGIHARKRILDEYDAPVAGRRFVEIYEEAIGSRRQ